MLKIKKYKKNYFYTFLSETLLKSNLHHNTKHAQISVNDFHQHTCHKIKEYFYVYKSSPPKDIYGTRIHITPFKSEVAYSFYFYPHKH